MTSADFCSSIATLLSVASPVADKQISQGKARDFIPIYPVHIRPVGPDGIGLRVFWPSRPPGVDGITVDELLAYCREHWSRIREEIRSGEYHPAPVRKVEIPKPGGKGTRMLGIPTVLDRMIQQALLQVLTPLFEPTFSKWSFGFRPGRSALGAVSWSRLHMTAGYRWVVDLDLEKFFDRVNHDILMSRVARRVKDPQVLRLIRRYLQAGMMEGGVVSPRREGTPQGGPLSPLLSNVLLDELDKELERRGHRFCRYADDCNVYVQSRRAGERRLGHDFLDLVVRDRALYPGPGFVVQTFQSLCYKATSPLAHRAPHGAQLPRDLRIRQSRRALQHDSGPERLVRRRPSAASQSLKRFGFFRGQLQLSQLPPVVFHALSRSQLDMVCLPFFVPGD